VVDGVAPPAVARLVRRLEGVDGGPGRGIAVGVDDGREARLVGTEGQRLGALRRDADVTGLPGVQVVLKEGRGGGGPVAFRVDLDRLHAEHIVVALLAHLRRVADDDLVALDGHCLGPGLRFVYRVDLLRLGSIPVFLS
jgi:hypothetical protein